MAFPMIEHTKLDLGRAVLAAYQVLVNVWTSVKGDEVHALRGPGR
jgi:hypothetical protein